MEKWIVFRKPYDFNVESRDIPIEKDLMLTEPEVSRDRSLLASLEHISDLRVASEDAEYEDTEDDISNASVGLTHKKRPHKVIFTFTLPKVGCSKCNQTIAQG